ncbi:MAG: DoxX family protein, partial [Polyangiaceae bacterium]
MQHWPSLHDLRWPGGDVRRFELPVRREPPRPRPDPARANDTWARRWLDRLEQPATGFALLRMYLGLGLIVRGALFISNPAVVQRFLTDAEDWALPYLGAHAIAGAHLVGGALLALGYRTRLAAAVQIPVLLGAAFFVHLREGLFTRGQSLEFSLLVLVLLVLYAVFGSGPLSLDHALRRGELLAAM